MRHLVEDFAGDDLEQLVGDIAELLRRGEHDQRPLGEWLAIAGAVHEGAEKICEGELLQAVDLAFGTQDLVDVLDKPVGCLRVARPDHAGEVILIGGEQQVECCSALCLSGPFLGKGCDALRYLLLGEGRPALGRKRLMEVILDGGILAWLALGVIGRLRASAACKQRGNLVLKRHVGLLAGMVTYTICRQFESRNLKVR